MAGAAAGMGMGGSGAVISGGPQKKRKLSDIMGKKKK